PHALGPRVHQTESDPQRPAFVARAVCAVDDLEALPALPAGQDLRGLVGGVVDQDHLVVGVLKSAAGLQQPLDHPLFVVAGDLDRYEGLVAELEAVAVPVPVPVPVTIPIAVAVAVAVSVAVPIPVAVANSAPAT